MVRKFKTLFIDIETSLMEVYAYRIGYGVDITDKQIKRENRIVCVSYKWSHEKEIHTIYWNRFKKCDRVLLKKLSKLLVEADEVVGHNGDKFDLKFINRRLIFHRLQPLPPLTTTDTLKLCRKVANFSSNKLGYVGKYLKVGTKLQHSGLQLWIDVEKGCDKAFKKMLKYCEQDVAVLEKIYNIIIKYAPNIRKGGRVLKNTPTCPNCDSFKLHKWGHYTTKAGIRHKRFRCYDCGTAFKIAV